MKSQIKIFFFLICIFQWCNSGYSQSEFDAIRQKISSAKTDSEKVYSLVEYSRELYIFDSVNRAFSVALKAIDLANKSHSANLRNEAILHHAFLFTVKGEYLPALDILNTIEQSIIAGNDLEKKKNFFITKGRVLSNLGKYSESLKFSLEALALTERVKDTVGRGKVLNNIGILYDYMGNKQKALHYYFQSLKIKTSLNDQRGAANSYANIGDIYRGAKKFDSSLFYTNKCLQIGKELADYNLLSLAYTNLGSTHLEMGQYQTALDFLMRSLSVDSLLGEEYGLCLDLLCIGQAYVNLKNYDKAKMYLGLSLEKSLKLHSVENIKGVYEVLSQLYFQTNNYKEAFFAFKEFKRYNDTIYNIENAKQFSDLKTQYEVDKKTAELEQKGMEEKVRHEAEIKQQKLILYFVSLAAVLVLTLFILSVRAYRQKQKANRIIVEQKELVEQKNKEVMDSINYARRIQKSLFPTEKYLERNLKKKE
jgi:tetratricopeptide (TPR) repeat protein